MNKNSIITIAIVGVGGYALYWYLNSYGASGAVSTFGGPGSYWASWFTSSTAGTGVAVGTGTGSTTVNQTTGQPTTSTTPGTTQTSTQPSAPELATAQQIQQIQALLRPSDLAQFSAMIPTLTFAQAAGMLSNAQTCAAAASASAFVPGIPAMSYSLAAGGCAPGAAANPGASPTTEAKLILASGGVNMLNVSQWNYYMQNGGNGQPPIEPNGSFPPLNDGGVSMTAAAYLSLRAQNGLSGIGNIMPIAPGITPATTGLNGMGNIMQLSPFITPADNGVRAGGAAGMDNGGGRGGPGAPLGSLPVVARVRSPWGHMPSRRVN